VQLGVYDSKKKSKNKPKKAFIKEIRLNAESTYKVGDKVTADVFAPGDFVDVSGTSKGKGFAGGMKRWNWRGGDGGHGSMFHRRIGSNAASSFPSRVFKGKTMPGHMGSVKKTVQNLEVVKIDLEANLLVVRGAVPGHNNGYLVIKEAVKKPKKVVKDDGKK
jgi:large subunit ribosomal protein L3